MREREREREVGRQAGRQADRQIERDRQTDREMPQRQEGGCLLSMDILSICFYHGGYKHSRKKS